jgi:hypothetical protein
VLKIIKWLYQLGSDNERKRIHRELLIYIGQKPERSLNPEINFQEDEKTFMGRVRTWNYARRLIEDFFDSDNFTRE